MAREIPESIKALGENATKFYEAMLAVTKGKRVSLSKMYELEAMAESQFPDVAVRVLPEEFGRYNLVVSTKEELENNTGRAVMLGKKLQDRRDLNPAEARMVEKMGAVRRDMEMNTHEVAEISETVKKMLGDGVLDAREKAILQDLDNQLFTIRIDIKDAKVTVAGNLCGEATMYDAAAMAKSSPAKPAGKNR